MGEIYIYIDHQPTELHLTYLILLLRFLCLYFQPKEAKIVPQKDDENHFGDGSHPRAINHAVVCEDGVKEDIEAYGEKDEDNDVEIASGADKPKLSLEAAKTQRSDVSLWVSARKK